MRSFFRLRDDVEVPNRWHLGDLTDDAGQKIYLNGAQRYLGSRSLGAEVTHVGRSLQFSETAACSPVTTSELAQAMKKAATDDIQIIDVRVTGSRRFVGVNALRCVECVDEQRSEFIKWTEEDEREDLLGSYKLVAPLRIKGDVVPATVGVFRVEGWEVALILSEAVKEAMEAVGCLGARFIDVS